jgi:predicted membrane protein DUF2243
MTPYDLKATWGKVRSEIVFVSSIHITLMAVLRPLDGEGIIGAARGYARNISIPTHGFKEAYMVHDERKNREFLTFAGILLGLGLGGFFDGIILHQVLQWHHMLTSAGYPADSDNEPFRLGELLVKEFAHHNRLRS